MKSPATAGAALAALACSLPAQAHVAIFADPTPQVRFAIRRPLWTIPASLVAAMVVFSGSYWSLHAVLYPAGEARPRQEPITW